MMKAVGFPHGVVFDQFITNMVAGKARQLVRGFRLSPTDQEDVQQELFLGLLKAAPSFDAKVAHWRSFATAVVHRTIVSMARHLQAEKRNTKNTNGSLNRLVHTPDDKLIEFGQTLDERTIRRHRGCWPKTDHEQVELKLDVTSVLESLSDQLRKSAKQLSRTRCCEVTDRSRRQLADDIGSLQIAMQKADVGPQPKKLRDFRFSCPIL